MPASSLSRATNGTEAGSNLERPKFLLVANPINRYSIGDRTAGLQLAADGSLTIYMQHESPGLDKESNWLPSPAGDFRRIMRMYQPKPEFLAGG